MFNTNINKYKIKGYNFEEFHILKKEIFGNDSYYFEIKNKNPYIIDIGSHIGVSVLYFKYIYPDSHITALEPNPELFTLLQENVNNNSLKNVTLINKGVNTKEKLMLNVDSTEEKWLSTGGYIVGGWTGQQKTKQIEVDCIRLETLLNRRVDILKIDIEGLEKIVLTDTESFLPNVNNIAVEYHPSDEKSFKKLIKILSKYFKLEFYFEGVRVKNPNYLNLMLIKGYLI